MGMVQKISDELRAQGIEVFPKEVALVVCRSLKFLERVDPKLHKRVKAMNDGEFIRHYVGLIALERKFEEETLRHKKEDLDKLISSR